jgi:hypothetical protein
MIKRRLSKQSGAAKWLVMFRPFLVGWVLLFFSVGDGGADGACAQLSPSFVEVHAGVLHSTSIPSF